LETRFFFGWGGIEAALGLTEASGTAPLEYIHLAYLLLLFGEHGTNITELKLNLNY
jgi:hypothetical protein